MVYVFAFYFLFHNNLPFCSRIHHYSFPLKSSIFLKFDLYFLHFCNFDLQLQVTFTYITYSLCTKFYLSPCSNAILPRSRTYTLARADQFLTRTHTHTRIGSEILHGHLPPLHITHQLLLLPWHRAGGRHFSALNTLAFALLSGFFFCYFLRQMPSIREF